MTKGMRRAATAALVALLPAACASGDVPAAKNQPVAEPAKPTKTLIGNYLAGRHAQAENDVGKAVRFLGSALTMDPRNPDLLRRYFVLMLMEGRTKEAVTTARRLLKLEKQAPFASLAVVADDIAKRAYKKAKARLDAMPKRGLNPIVVPLLKAWTLVGLKRPEEALNVLKPLAERNGSKTLFEFHNALINESMGRRDAAEKSYLKVAEGQSGMSYRLVELLGGMYERAGAAKKARGLYDRYIQENPRTRLMEPALARLDKKGRPPALETATAAGGAAEALFGLASSLRQQNVRETALFLGRLALHMKPDFAVAQMLLADVLESLGRHETANKVYAAMAKGSPFYWSGALRIATNLDRMKKTSDAIKALKRLAKQNPNRPDPLINLGDILRGNERFDEAVAAYDQAAAVIGQLKKQHWSLLYARGIALEQSKKWARAEADFLKALEFQPDQPYVLNYLGYSWVDRGQHLEKAQDMIRKAVKLRPTDGFIVDSLGWVLYRLGDFEGSVKELERAVELRPEDPIINDHLGDALWRVGRLNEARFQWRRVLGLKPEAKLEAAIQKKLKHGLVEEAKVKNGG